MRVLRENCLACHGDEKHKGGLRLTSREGLLKGGDDGEVLQRSNPGESLFLRVLRPNSDPHMPPKGQLSADEIDLLTRWALAGAPWDAGELAKLRGPRAVSLEALPSDYRPVEAIVLDPQGRRLAFGRGNHLVIHDITETNLPLRQETIVPGDVIRALAWSRDGRWIATGGFRDVTLWNADTLRPVWRGTSNLLGRITALRFTPHGGALIAGDSLCAEAGWIRLFDARDGTPLAAWKAHTDAVTDISVSPDGGLLASAGGDKLIRIWELASRREVAQIEGHLGSVRGVAFNPDATQLISVGADRQLRLWDWKTGEALVTIAGRRHALDAVAWSADGSRVAAVDDDGRLYGFTDFKPHTGAQSSATAKERELGHWNGPLHAVAICPDGRLIIAGGEDGTVYAVNDEGKLVDRLVAATDLNNTDEGSAAARTGNQAIDSVSPRETGANLSNPSTPPPPPSFLHEVLPALAKAGCAAGSCHAKPEGQNGFHLSVFSYDPAADYAEIVDEERGRRVFPACPDESLLVLKPTATLEHGGGRRFAHGSDLHQLLREWMRRGMVYRNPGEPSLEGIGVDPVHGSYARNSSHPLRVEARYSDGTRRDVTALAEYVPSDREIVEAGEDGILKIGSIGGEAVVVVRFMGFVDVSRVTVPTDHRLPPERYAELAAYNFIDRLAYAQFQRLGLFPSELCTDAEFVRRLHLDLLGTLPTPDETRSFLIAASRDSRGVRAALVDRLLESPELGDYWANKWADLLRPNPDRVGVKSVYVLDEWLRASFRANKPYDQFVRDILLAEGSSHGEGPIVVYRDRREPQEIATLVSQLFLGVRMECAKCHHHPNEKWSQDDFYQFAAVFGGLRQKGAGLSPPISAGTESFYAGGSSRVENPVTGSIMKPRAPDGPGWDKSATDDPRHEFADWLTSPANPFFSRAAVNRVWAAFFGRGFVEPVDDFRVSNPVSNEPLLDAVARDFADHGYDLKHLMRTIADSRLYQLSSTPTPFNQGDTRSFSRAYRRRLPAEVLLDAVNDVTEVGDDFNGCPPALGPCRPGATRFARIS